VFLPRLLTAFEAIRLLCGSTRLVSRWTLALIHIWAKAANASSVVHDRVPRWGRRCSLSRPPPASGRCLLTPTERAPCLVASWNKESTYVQIVQGVLPAGSGFFIPRLQRRGLSNPILGNRVSSIVTKRELLILENDREGASVERLIFIASYRRICTAVIKWRWTTNSKQRSQLRPQ
jgi:hypothetical protein